MGFAPYFRNGAPPDTDDHEGFLRVRVSDDVMPTGYVAVYLATGTQVMVAAHEVLLFDSRDPWPPDEIERPTDR